MVLSYSLNSINSFILQIARFEVEIRARNKRRTQGQGHFMDFSIVLKINKEYELKIFTEKLYNENSFVFCKLWLNSTFSFFYQIVHLCFQFFIFLLFAIIWNTYSFESSKELCVLEFLTIKFLMEAICCHCCSFLMCKFLEAYYRAYIERYGCVL